MSNKPRRKLHLITTIEADSYRDLAGAINSLAFEATVSAEREKRGEEPQGGEGLSLQSTSGGYSWSWIYELATDGMEHDAYFEAIERKLAERREAKAGGER